MGVATLGMASYAATFMEVKTNDGNVVKFDVESVNQVVFEDSTPVDTTPISNHPYVDLGLPSGTLWATYNIGATKPEEYGDYFAWGETEPKEVYSWSTYKYATTSGVHLDYITKYNMSSNYGGIIDDHSVLFSEDDAATANWGNEWRMPTYEEQIELCENCYMVWTDGYNGTDVRGMIFYKAKSSDDKGVFVGRKRIPSSDYSESSDAHVFLPSAGSILGDESDFVGSTVVYWSSSLYEKNEIDARSYYFYENEADWNAYERRFIGQSVRAVRAK